MSSNITNISHGQANWDTAINQNFKNLDADSGWVSVPLLAPFKGQLSFRKTAHSMTIYGKFSSTEEITAESGAPVAIFPKIGDSYYWVSLSEGRNAFVRLSLSPDGTLNFLDSTQDITVMLARLSKSFII